jgi:diguanylate cyclase (GGDEF)-like protein
LDRAAALAYRRIVRRRPVRVNTAVRRRPERTAQRTARSGPIRYVPKTRECVSFCPVASLQEVMMSVRPAPIRYSAEKIAVVGLLAALYGVVYLVTYSHFSYGGAPFGAATVVVAGWFFGIRGGLIASLFVSVENLLLLYSVLGHDWQTIFIHANISGLVSLVLIACAIGHMSDLSRKVKAYTELLQYEAFHDPLTRLPNRALFYDRLEHAIARVSRGPNSVALLFLDLDGFKQINDQHGHLIGDKLLTTFAERLSDTLRLGDTFARLGGDEFVILLEDLPDLKAAELAAERIEAHLRHPFTIGNTEISITASIGIAFREAGTHCAEDILLDADHAMYQAKTSGKARYQIFQPDAPSNAKLATKQIMAMGD